MATWLQSRLSTFLRPIIENVVLPPLAKEVSGNQRRLGHWGWKTPGAIPLTNPDDLVGRKGLPTYAKMRRDDQIKAVLALRKHAVLSTGWRIVPATERGRGEPDPAQVAAFVEWSLRQGMDEAGSHESFEGDLKEILTCYDFGFSVTEKVSRLVEAGPWAGKLALRKLATRMPYDFTFLVDGHDNLLPYGISQFGGTFPTSKFVLAAYAKEFDNWYGQSELRAAYEWWWFKMNVVQWWGIFLDRYSIPFAMGTVPSALNVASTEIDTFKEMIQNIQADTSMVVPEGFTVAFPSAGNAQGSQIFEMAIRKADAGIAKAVLVPNLLGVAEQGDVGSYSQARKQFDVFILVVEADQRWMAEAVLGAQLIRPLVDVNFPSRNYPRFEFLPFTESNKGELLGLFLQALAGQVVNPRPEDEAHVRQITEFPEVPEDVLVAEAEERKTTADAQAQAGAMGGMFEAPPGPQAPAALPEEEMPPGEGEDPELDVMIAEALGGDAQGGSGDGEDDPLTDAVAEALAKRGVKAYAQEISRVQITEAIVALREEWPDATDEELVGAAVDELADGEADLDEAELDRLLAENGEDGEEDGNAAIIEGEGGDGDGVQGEGSGEAPEEGLTDEELDALIAEALAEDEKQP